jgi:hypothetical protein
MERVAGTLHTSSEHGVSSITTITTADAHTSVASSRLNFKWTRPFRRKNLVSARVPSHFKRSLPRKQHITSWVENRLLAGVSFQNSYSFKFIPLKDSYFPDWLNVKFHYFLIGPKTQNFEYLTPLAPIYVTSFSAS